MTSTVSTDSANSTEAARDRRTASPWVRRGALAVLGGVALALGTPLAAMAHVYVSSDTTAAGSEAVVTLTVPHGCDGSPTTKLTMTVPAGINEVLPTVEAGWTVTKTTEKLDAPITLDDGDQLTERTSRVVWTARTPLPDGFRAEVSFGVGLPADAAGQTLSFPVVQACEKGSTEWTQIPAAGVSEEDLEDPAPSLVVTAASAEEGHDHATGTHSDTEPAAEAGEGASEGASEGATAGATEGSTDGATVTAVSTDAAGTGGGSGTGLGIAGLVAGLLGLGAGVTALLRTRGPSRQS